MITGLEIENLRAYGRLSLQLQGGINFVVGPNAVGKTSLLESISLAFVGEALTVRDLTSLMRDPAVPSKVRVAFVQDGTAYVVERNLRVNGVRGQCYLQKADGRRVRQRWDELTGRVEGIFGTTAAFFKRIIYMGEGDISRFVTEPPGETVMSQIDRLLGIDQLEASKEAVRTALKHVGDRIEACEDVLADYEEQVGVSSLMGDERLAEEPLAALERLRSKIGDRETTLKHVGQERARLARGLGELEELQADLANLTQVLAEGGPPERAEIPVTERLSGQVRLKASDAEALEKAIGEFREKVGRLKGRREAQDDILRLLQPPGISAEGTRTTPCPVCRKPLTHAERIDILSDAQEEMRSILDAQRTAERQLAQDEATLSATRDELGTLRENERRVGERMVKHPDVVSPNAAQAKLATLREELRAVDLEARACRDQLSQLLDAVSTLSRLNQQLESLGFAGLSAVREGLVGLTKAELVLAASRRAIEATVAEQRGQNLQGVYRQIAEAWKSFVERSEWRVEFDSEGRPSLHDVDEGRTFDLTQLSGGEKTALLAIIHSVLASRFCEAQFMMIDEPLEHLDVVNRRSLVKFFVEAFDKGFFKQIVITTFEESLVRKYLSEPRVNVIYLDGYRPELRLLAQESA